MNVKLLGAVLGGFAFATVNVSAAEEKPAKKADKKGEKKDGEKKEGGEKSCGGEKGCGGHK